MNPRSSSRGSMPSPTRIRSEEIARSEIIMAPMAAVHSAADDQTLSGRPATTMTSAGASENEESATDSSTRRAGRR